ncbi:hypothetical protein TrST_g7456 [Triparma strigata]|uniref:Uncharacterized protein n=1 Tax=Triparma strigata TaxID=1606541 RepID=A0A9W7BN03_9STRA|nr:hypothetical protein TrST_g7456 [Triparma strigata]
MPSLVRYAHEILSEDRYGHAALAKVDERVASLNDAQLVGMVTHLSGSMSRARSELWRYANKTVLETVKDEFEIREEDHRLEELRDYQENREEREAEEMENMRRAEKEAAEKQISRTAEREAREEVDKFLQEFNTLAKIKLMEKTYRARNWRFYGWSLSISTGTSMTIALHIMEQERTVAFSQDMMLIGLIGGIVTVVSGLIGWKWGQAKQDRKTEEEIAEMVDARKQEKLVEFHERDRILRKKIEEQDLADQLEKQERMRARKAEKRKIRRMEKERKTAHDKMMKEKNDKRKELFLKDTKKTDEPKDADQAKPDALLSIAAASALKSVEGMKPPPNKVLGAFGIKAPAAAKVAEPQTESPEADDNLRVKKEKGRSTLMAEEGALMRKDLDHEELALANRRKTDDIKKSVEEFGNATRGRGNRAVVIPTSKNVQQLLETAAEEDDEKEKEKMETKQGGGGGGGGFGGLLGKLKKPTISPMDDGEEVPKLELLVEEGGAGGEGVDIKSNNDLEKLEEGKLEADPPKKKKKMMFRRESQLVKVMGDDDKPKKKVADENV